MKIYFVTTNKHKFAEVEAILKEYPIELEHLDMEYAEDHDESMEVIASTAAKKLANELGKAVVLEDTGIFFEAYNNFPGALPKFVFNTIGYEGMFKLLEGKSRKAYFKTVAAFCKPNEEPVLFEGIMKGKIAEKVHNEDKDLMPYERIIIPEGYDVTNSDLSREEKNKISHRASAFKKFGEFIKNEH